MRRRYEKFQDLARQSLGAPGPQEVKNFATSKLKEFPETMYSRWEQRVRRQKMKDSCKSKYTSQSYYTKCSLNVLMTTGTHEIVKKVNNDACSFWVEVPNGEGHNHIGLMLTAGDP